MSRDIKTLVPAFGGNRTNAPLVGELLDGIPWVGIPFAGGLPEVLYIKARTLMVGDEHRHLLNLAAVISRPEQRKTLQERLSCYPFHPDVLAVAQRVAAEWADEGQANARASIKPDLDAAEAYFVSQWMVRSGTALTKKEFTGGLPVRWDAAGGDSAKRYRSAVEALTQFGQAMERATFFTGSVFLFLRKAIDSPRHGIYCDPPWPGAGQKYLHDVDDDQFHQSLRDALKRYQETRVVVRYGDCDLVRELYQPVDGWEVIETTGKRQSNRNQQEIYLVRNRKGAK